MSDPGANAGGIILVVDDEPLVLSFLTGTLARYGYRVLQAESGVQALRLCRERGRVIDLIVTDVVMPELDGRQVVDAIRKLGLDPHALFMSGYARGVALERGVDDRAHFIQKPFTPSQLLAKVREVLAHPRAKTSSADASAH